MKNKIMFIFLALVSIMLLVPNRASAETVYPEVTNDTKPDTLVDGDIKVEGSGTDTITVTVSGGTFKLLDATTSAQEGTSGNSQRPDNYAWIGLRFKFGTGVTNVEIGPQGNDFDSKKTTFTSNDFTEYFGINVEGLKAASQNKEDLKKVAIVKWKENNENREMTVNIIVKPENITLYQKGSDDTVAWDVENWLTESKHVAIDYYLLDGEDTTGFTIYWDKETPLTMEDIQAVVNTFDEKYAVAGVYADKDKKAEFELGEITDNHTAIYVELSLKELAESTPSTDDVTTEENPNTIDNVTTYIALGAISIILSLGSVLYLRKENN